jgi:hypothetical protein
VESERGDRLLSDALRVIGRDHGGPSAAVEARLRAEVRRVAARRRQRIAATCAAAAVLVVAVAVPVWKRSGRQAANPTAVSQTALESTTDFLPLPYSSVPTTSAQLVRLQVPRAALARFGLAPIEMLDAPASETVPADVLVGEDGLARAIRFVRPAQETMNP